MQEQSSPGARAQMTPDNRTVIVDGYAMSLTVKRGQLVIRSRETERVISRIECSKTRQGIARIMILSRVGSITLEAVNWCAALDVSIVRVDRDGSVSLCTPGLIGHDARMYKQQILAQPDMPNAGTGLKIVKDLLTAKMAGQQEIVAMMGRTDKRISECLTMMAAARDIRSILAIEGNAAIAYWRQWEDRVFVPWDLDALRYIPGHWSRFSGRATVTRADGYTETSNRNARDFVNACLNYGYKIAETEAMIACHALGLHPSLGLSHGAIHENKAALALDILEPLRPIVDKIVLSYLDHGQGIPFTETGKPAYLDRECAYELDDGICRLSTPMTSRLASAVSMAVAASAMQWAERIARSLAVTAHISVVSPFDPRLKYKRDSRELADTSTPETLIPDHIWIAVRDLIPEVAPGIGRRSEPRAILAGIVAHEIYSVSWPRVQAVCHLDFRTCRKRLAEWETAGIWDTIRAQITNPGVSQQRIVS